MIAAIGAACKHDEDRQTEPLDGAGKSHADAEADAGDAAENDADDQRLERR